MSTDSNDVTDGQTIPEPAPTPVAAGPRTSGATAPSVYTADPTNASAWIRPGYAVIVVCAVAVALLAVVGWAMAELQVVGPETAREADPNAGTIAAIAAAGLSSLTSLAAAYFGIKVASEQAGQANTTATAALEVASRISANSTANGNPTPDDF